MNYIACVSVGALYNLSNLRFRLDIGTLIFCSTLIFTQHLLLIEATAKTSALQRYGMIKIKIVQTTMNHW